MKLFVKNVITALVISASLIPVLSHETKAQDFDPGSALTTNERPNQRGGPVYIYNQAGFPIYYDIIRYPSGRVRRDVRLDNGSSKNHSIREYGVVEYDYNVCQGGIQVGSRRVYPGQSYRFQESGSCYVTLR